MKIRCKSKFIYTFTRGDLVIIYYNMTLQFCEVIILREMSKFVWKKCEKFYL